MFVQLAFQPDKQIAMRRRQLTQQAVVFTGQHLPQLAVAQQNARCVVGAAVEFGARAAGPGLAGPKAAAAFAFPLALPFAAARGPAFFFPVGFLFPLFLRNPGLGRFFVGKVAFVGRPVVLGGWRAFAALGFGDGFTTGTGPQRAQLSAVELHQAGNFCQQLKFERAIGQLSPQRLGVARHVGAALGGAQVAAFLCGLHQKSAQRSGLGYVVGERLFAVCANEAVGVMLGRQEQELDAAHIGGKGQGTV